MERFPPPGILDTMDVYLILKVLPKVGWRRGGDERTCSIGVGERGGTPHLVCDQTSENLMEPASTP